MRAFSQLLRLAPHAQALARYRSRPGRIVLPDVSCDLVWTDGHLSVTGPMSKARLSSGPNASVTLLQLDPLTARAWLATPLELLTDKAVALADINDSLSRTLQALHENDSLAALVKNTEAVPPASLDNRISGAVAALRRGLPISRVAEQCSLSERQFERVFRRECGLSPKLFARIVRFRRAALAAKAGRSLAEAAMAAGYADQSHLARETQKLTGFSLSALLPNVGNVQDLLAGRM